MVTAEHSVEVAAEFFNCIEIYLKEAAGMKNDEMFDLLIIIEGFKKQSHTP